MGKRPPSSPLHPTQCEGCDAPIWFAPTENHKTMPLDAKPTADGNIACHRDDRGQWHSRVLRAGQEPTAIEKRYTTHFQTCDHPEAFRRRQRRQIAADLARDDRSHQRRPITVREPGAAIQPSLFGDQ